MAIFPLNIDFVFKNKSLAKIINILSMLFEYGF